MAPSEGSVAFDYIFGFEMETDDNTEFPLLSRMFTIDGSQLDPHLPIVILSLQVQYLTANGDELLS